MSGAVVFLGGSEFTDVHAELDRALLAETGVEQVVLLPTAAAYEEPDRVAKLAEAHFAELGAGLVVVPALDRTGTNDPANAELVRNARLIYMPDGSTMHAEATLKRSAVWDALVGAHRSGAIVVASGASARVLCDPMVDPRGGAFAVGLGLVTGLCVVPHAETWSEDRQHRTRALLPEGVTLHVLDSSQSLRV